MPLCTDDSRPGHCKSSTLGADVEGFYLDPTADARERGMLDGASVEEIEAGRVPVYYQYVPGNYVAYWFFWPYSVPGSGVGGAVDLAHQGDWEHVVVRLNPDNMATAVEYFFHHWWSAIPWDQAPHTDDDHPIVYAAEEGHGSYWAADCNFRVEWPESVTDVAKILKGQTFDRCSTGGPRWNTWENLRDATSQSWYGFGGAWGRVGHLKDTTGPPSPHPDLTPTGDAQPDGEYRSG